MPVNNSDFAPVTTYNHATRSSNLIWNPNGSLNLGMEFLYGWKMLQMKGKRSSIQFSAKYNFVKVE